MEVPLSSEDSINSGTNIRRHDSWVLPNLVGTGYQAGLQLLRIKWGSDQKFGFASIVVVISLSRRSQTVV